MWILESDKICVSGIALVLPYKLRERGVSALDLTGRQEGLDHLRELFAALPLCSLPLTKLALIHLIRQVSHEFRKGYDVIKFL